MHPCFNTEPTSRKKEKRISRLCCVQKAKSPTLLKKLNGVNFCVKSLGANKETLECEMEKYKTEINDT